VRPHAFYAGSIERLTFNEVGRDKGVLEVDLETKEVIFHKLDLRPMGDLANIDAAGLNADELLTAIEHAVGEKKDEIIRVTIDNVSQETQGGFDYNRLKELMRREIHFEVKMVKEDTSEETSAVSPAIGNLHDEFIAFMTGKPAGKDHDKLLELGLDYLDRAARDRA
jgi:DNA repair exonuclease SbcCD nuclease subunit